MIGGSAAGGSEVALGAAVAVVSVGLYDIGYILEKQALTALPSLPAHPVRLWRTCARSPRWLAGFAAMLAGLALQLVALTLAPVTVVQPILAAGVLGVAAAGRLVLGERFGSREAVAFALVAVAVAAVAVSASPGGQVARHAAAGRFGLLAGTAVVVAVALVVVARRRRAELPARRAELPARRPDPDRSGGSPVLVAEEGEARSSDAGLYGVAALAVAAGLLYGVGAVAEKAVATQMVDKGIGTGAVGSVGTGYPWIFVAATLAGMIAFQIGLQRHHASMVVPLTNVISSVCVLAGAALVFSERLLPTGWWAVPRVTGFAGVLAAVVVLAVDRRTVPAPALA